MMEKVHDQAFHFIDHGIYSEIEGNYCLTNNHFNNILYVRVLFNCHCIYSTQTEKHLLSIDEKKKKIAHEIEF